MNQRPEVVVALVAPTGAGKTRTLLALRERLPFEVLSADSVQAIRGFDIGSAKPDADERRRLPHHLIDMVDPDQRYTAWRFARDADVVVTEAAGRAMPLIATAGTGFYLKAWSEGLPDVPELDRHRVDALQTEARAHPRETWARLQARDPARADRIHPHDWIRTARALAIVEATGQLASEARPERPGPQLHFFGIAAEGPAYEAGLTTRIDRMLAAGWIDEVEALRAGWGRDLPGLDAIGYRQIAECLDGRLARGELAEAVRLATRRYARRQRIWFRPLPVRWFPFHPDRPDPDLLDALHKALVAADPDARGL